MNIFSNELKTSILAHFQLEKSSVEKQEKFLQSFEQLGNEIALNTILDLLDEAQSLIFLRLGEEGEDEKALEYARSKIVDLDRKIVGEISKAIKELEVQ